MYFVQRLRSNFYKAEINQIKTNDSPIKIKLNSSRLRSFKDSELKEKYSKELYLELRLVTVELGSGQKERLLTNIPPEIMSTEDIYIIFTVKDGLLKLITDTWKKDSKSKITPPTPKKTSNKTYTQQYSSIIFVWSITIFVIS